MNAEYFHLKTTPDMPVRAALRMSMGIPGKSDLSHRQGNSSFHAVMDEKHLLDKSYPLRTKFDP